MPKITLSGGTSFDVEPAETILDGAIRAGIALEHSCRTGRCGTCKAHVLKGETVAVQPEAGLGEETNAILVCARRAVGDVRLDMRPLGDFHLPPAKILPCRIQALQKLASDVLVVTLRFPPRGSPSFLAGQYVDVTARNGARRSYSIANAARDDGTLDLHVRRVAGGAMSRYWFEEAAKDDLLRLNGPLGTFFLRDVTGRSLVMLATGTGIAPIKAILEDMARGPSDKLPRSIHVFWGGREPGDLYWDPSKALEGVHFTPVLSRAVASWTGARGHVQEAVLAAGLLTAAPVVYACGSPAMIDSARERLTEACPGELEFHADAFLPSSQNRMPIP